MGHVPVFALADDLSGAAETAAVLMSPERPARITLSGPPYVAMPPVLVADLDTRHRPGAAALVREALASAGDRHVLIKIDSLLRGDIAATVHACLTTPARSASVPVVLACALPQAGRTVVNGVPLIHGIPLRETRTRPAQPQTPPTTAPTTGSAAGTAAGSAAGTAAGTTAGTTAGSGVPATVAETLGGVPSAGVGLDTVRAGRAALMQALAKVAASGRVAVCDAETDGDLDTIVAAALVNDPATRLIGAGGLAAALGRALNPAPAPAPPGPPPPPADGSSAGVPVTGPTSPQVGGPAALLVVVGTAEPAAAEQARLLVAHGAEPVTLDAADLAAVDPGTAAGPRTAAEPVVGRVRRALAGGVAVLTVRGPAPPSLTAILGRTVREALGATRADLVLTGGETARRVLDALDVRELIPVGQVHHGAVHSRTPDGRSVVTRPGSFGGRDSLLRIAAHLRPGRFPTTTIDERPT
ncbi:four-carbon acid sugar kinase family protein [Nonomuraea sp. B5E05]|uniref:four-carbon acid sugar kinase family protein n=1 Tax=Nonomuraea sp. B5E05 TaxID=3153569 RepID=UPI003260DCB4